MAEKKNANATPAPATPAPASPASGNLRRWETPSYRAAYYAVERKNRVHMRGGKNGQQLTPTEATFRSGYLQCQGDHAAAYKYHKAIAEKKSKQEATIISQTVNSRPAQLPPPRKKKGN